MKSSGLVMSEGVSGREAECIREMDASDQRYVEASRGPENARFQG
jgi:hypothetical protein